MSRENENAATPASLIGILNKPQSAFWAPVPFSAGYCMRVGVPACMLLSSQGVPVWALQPRLSIITAGHPGSRQPQREERERIVSERRGWEAAGCSWWWTDPTFDTLIHEPQRRRREKGPGGGGGLPVWKKGKRGRPHLRAISGVRTAPPFSLCARHSDPVSGPFTFRDKPVRRVIPTPRSR